MPPRSWYRRAGGARRRPAGCSAARDGGGLDPTPTPTSVPVVPRNHVHWAWVPGFSVVLMTVAAVSGTPSPADASLARATSERQVGHARPRVRAGLP